MAPARKSSRSSASMRPLSKPIEVDTLDVTPSSRSTRSSGRFQHHASAPKPLKVTPKKSKPSPYQPPTPASSTKAASSVSTEGARTRRNTVLESSDEEEDGDEDDMDCLPRQDVMKPASKKRKLDTAPPTPRATPPRTRPASRAPSRTSRTANASKKAATVAKVEIEEEEEGEEAVDEVQTPSRAARSSSKRTIDVASATSTQTPTRRARVTKSKAAQMVVHDEAEEETPIEIEPLQLKARSTPSRTPAKRKAVVIEDQVASEDEGDVFNDENRPAVLPHDRLDEDNDDVDRTEYPEAEARPLLASVLGVIYGRQQPPSLSAGEVDTKAALASQPCLPTLETWEADVRSQLDRTIRDGEGNCMLLLGPPGVGKTAILDRSLHLLGRAHGTDAFITIRISGSISTTDRLTLREIARQLCTDVAGIDDDGSSFTSHATILQSLLTLLEPQSSTISATTTTLDRSKPIIFILDDFDRFAERDDRQSFLYCLLDIVQSKRRKGGMAVIGVSQRVDCLDRLEKRVRSRCQSRVLRVLPPASFADYLSIARVTLSCAESDTPISKDWNDGVEAFLDDSSVQRALRDLYDLRACTGELLQYLGTAVARYAHAVATGKPLALPCLRLDDLPGTRTRTERFPLSTLPKVCIAVLIAAKHATTSSPKSFITPASIYARHTAHVRSTTLPTRFADGALHRALESLLQMGALVDAAGVTPNAAAAMATSPYRRLKLAVWNSDLDAAVKKRGDLPVDLRQWCVRG